MKYNFSDDVRRALAFARDEAHRLGHDYVGTEHQLLGLLRLQDSRALKLLRALGTTAEELVPRLEASVRRGRAIVSLGELPYTSRAKKVLELGMAATREMKDRGVDSEHLLIGLLREEKGIAAHVLEQCGVTLVRVQLALSGSDPGPPPARPSAPDATGARAPAGPAVQPAPAGVASTPAFRIELDDRSDRSIYEQIIARVQEAVATGELGAGARLPAVRQLADQLDIAPGTVARAYSELERQGVVVTEGARGTRIAEASAESQPKVDLANIAGLLRPAAVAAFHMGAGAADMRRALEAAMKGIFAE